MQRKPRPILYVISCLRVGGGERQLVEFVRQVDRTRWRPIVACFDRVGEFVPQLVELGVDPIEFPLKGDLEQPNTAYQVARMAAMIARHRVGVVHGYDFWGNVIALLAGRLAMRPVVVSQLDQGRHLSPLQRKGQSWARRLASCVVVNAEALAREVIAQGTPARKVRVLHQGIQLDRFDVLAEGDPKLPAWDGKSVACVANMQSDGKGHEDLIRAAAKLPRVRFLLCGDGEHRPILQRLAGELGVADRVLFLGKRPDVPAIVSRVDALVHPSLAEGLPNAIMEAMAARRPVVATSVGGIPELVLDGSTGFLVPPRDPNALASALDRVLGDPERASAMGRAGRAHVERRFTLRRMTEQHDELYEELAA
jgi:glycosyltransferase involved in cell wall biosynthesis